ncbi:glycosyltransferase family 39 protein [Carboxydocella sp. ULO1]|uniref:ArnT family glycosyltransferase n=1 Tax=Carboxydocella sp. ULO1 TaxID=1926599 RepID=UPI0009ADE2E3|nr:glycosyltransferase family 39 protein [Carboxydocella sp. ULO1]GAW29468.1 hypothetical protein ULO1_20380 [Carboxydocella sp. ULO1]
MELTWFIIKHYLIIIGLLVSSFLLGFIFLKKFNFKTDLELFFFSTSLGIGIWAIILFVLGLIGLLYKEVIYFINIVIFIKNLSKSNINLRSIFLSRKDCIKDSLIILGLLFIIYPIFIFFLYPPTAWDSISSHLAAAKIYANSHALVYTPYLRYPVFNQNTELLFSVMLLIADDIAAQSISWVANLLVVIGIYSFSSHFFNRGVGIISVTFWLSAPLVLRLASIGYVDINLTLFTVAACFSGFIFLKETDIGWAYLSAVFFGFAVGTKYSALIVITLFILLLFSHYLKVGGFREAIKLGFKYGMVGLIISLPWFLRNYFYSGNPFFPFFSKVFGLGKIWTKDDYNGQIQDLLYSHGLQKNIVNLLDIPHELSFHWDRFLIEAPFTPIFFFGLILFLSVPQKGKYILSIFLIWVSYLVIWFYSAQIPRYLLIIWPLACITFGWATDYWISKVFSRAKIKDIAAYLISAILLFNISLPYLQRELNNMGDLPVTSEDRDEYLSRLLPTYPAYKYLNSQEKSTIYALLDENMNYFYKGTFIGDWFGPGRYSQILNSINSGQALYNTLKKLNVKYFVVNLQRTKNISLPSDEFFQSHFLLEYENEYVKVFSLH